MPSATGVPTTNIARGTLSTTASKSTAFLSKPRSDLAVDMLVLHFSASHSSPLCNREQYDGPVPVTVIEACQSIRPTPAHAARASIG